MQTGHGLEPTRVAIDALTNGAKRWLRVAIDALTNGAKRWLIGLLVSVAVLILMMLAQIVTTSRGWEAFDRRITANQTAIESVNLSHTLAIDEVEEFDKDLADRMLELTAAIAALTATTKALRDEVLQTRATLDRHREQSEN
jgi:PIN domain nuclease of toxin-antitoxin system